MNTTAPTKLKATETTPLLYIKNGSYATSVASQTQEENVKEREEKAEREERGG
jgi:hypothetical protein